MFCNLARSAATSASSFLLLSNTKASRSPLRRGYRASSRDCSLELSPESTPGSHSSCPASVSRSSSWWRGRFASRTRSSVARRSSSSLRRRSSSSRYEGSWLVDNSKLSRGENVLRASASVPGFRLDQRPTSNCEVSWTICAGLLAQFFSPFLSAGQA